MNKAGRWLALVLVAACWACFPDFAGAGGRAECLAMPSRILARAVPFCALLPPSYDGSPTGRYPVLYFLHGLGDDEQSLVRFGGVNLVEDLWGKGKLGEVLIVMPEGGARFYVKSPDGRGRSQEFFFQEVLTFLEHHQPL